MVKNKSLSTRQTEHIYILSKKEYNDIYSIPHFKMEEKEIYFSLNYHELKKFNNIKSNESKILFVLQLGYFKARFQFYSFRLKDVKEDVKWLSDKYLKTKKLRNYDLLSYEKSGREHRKYILNHLKFTKFENSAEISLILTKFCQTNINPKYLFFKLYAELIRKKIVIPGYKTFQLVIRKAILDYEKNLFSRIKQIISKTDAKKIEHFMEFRDKNTSKLAFLRTSSQGFKLKYINEEVEKRSYLEPLFPKAKELIKELNLSEVTIKKYAKYIDAYQYSHIKKWNTDRQHLHILCFIYYRYLRSNDDFMMTYIYWISKYENDIKSSLREKILKENMENSKSFPKFAKFIKVIYNKELWESLSKKQIWEKIISILDEDEARKIEEYFEKNYKKHGNLKWKLYDKIYYSIKKHMRLLLKNLNFEFSDGLKKSNRQFIVFYDNFQDSISKKKKIDWTKLPLKSTDKETKYILESDKRHEIYFYNYLKQLIKLGEIYISDSLEHRHIENDLIPKKYFDKNKKQILEEINLPYTHEPMSETLKNKISHLDKLYHVVNKKIISGKNKYFNSKSEANWTLRYEAQEENSYENLFSEYKEDLIDVLKYVDSKTNFLSKFEHIAPKNVKKEIDPIKILATLVGYGTNLGLHRIQKNLTGLFSEKELKNVALTRFREETLNEANKEIVNKTAELSIYDYFNIDDIGTIYSSSDGQKFSVSVNTITARYSQKYFGKGKGLSVLTLSANYQPLASKLISANDYEGHYVLELLLMNQSDIQPNKHSTDNHGINEANFAMLDFFGFKFCPRYKTINKKTHLLVGSTKKFPKNYKIKPADIIRKKNILQEEDNIKRVIASIALGKTTASTIIKKITNLPYKNSLRIAFAEFNKIIASSFILEYINNNELRQHIQFALNRGEAFHRLKKAIFYADNGKIKGKSESEQIVYQNSAMLICSAIIFYNCKILSKLINNKKISKDEFETIIKSSPFVWNHIEIYGKYEFNKKDTKKIEDKLK